MQVTSPADGDAGTALLAVYDQHAPACLRLARGLLRDETAAEAAVADVFVSLWHDLRAGRRPGAHAALARTLLACRPRAVAEAGLPASRLSA